MNQEIVSYLKSAEPDFDQGFALFCKYSRNRTAMDWISRRHDREKLLYELGKLAKWTVALNPSRSEDITRFTAVAPKAVAPAVVPASVAPAEEKKSFRTYDDRRTRRSDLPPALQEVYDAITLDYRLRRGYHEKMKAATTDVDRAEFRARVMEVDARIRENWAVIDDYLSEAATKETSQETFNESTCRSYISKCLKREKNTARQAAVCRARVRALLDRGYALSPDTLAGLKEKGLA